MEARSLTPLNLLAGNPPQYPENPSEQKLEPIVLYISRVPGTRDVILSPFKPQLKNVTSGDVASSLYYVHHELPILDSPSPMFSRNDGLAKSIRDASPARMIARKPINGATLSLAPSISSDNGQQLPPMNVGGGDPTPRQPGNFGVDLALPPPSEHTGDSGVGLSDSSSDLNFRAKSQPIPSLSQRKPLEPAPLVNMPVEGPEKTFSLLQQPGRSSVDESRARNQLRFRTNSAGSARNSYPPKKRSEFSTPPFTLSLIRRDPSTGDQWNVGKISSYETETFVGGYDQSAAYISANTGLQPPQHPPIDIQIESAGYAKFRHMPSNTSRISMDAGRPSIDMASMHQNEGGIFFRQVVMSYSRSWTTTLRSKFNQIEQAARKKAHDRQGSGESAKSFRPAERASGSPNSKHVDKTKARGYIFMSPWNGRCEFHTGNGGRSLLCHHILHEGETGTYNPLVPDAKARKSTSAVVSELRFNLPGSDLFPSSDVPKDVGDRPLGHFSKLINSAVSRAEDDKDRDVVSPFDLNMGSERAGGGNDGKRAKLGKLIIYHDGSKMLDLLVAANMGLWWGSWERSF